jgi:hypothetical protein
MALARERRLSDLVVRHPGYRSRGPGSITGATWFSEVVGLERGLPWVELKNYLEEKVSAPV